MSLLRKLYYLMPARMRRIARRVRCLPQEVVGRRQRVNGVRIPHKGLIYTGGGDYVKLGEELLERLIAFHLIQPSSCVLDIGSGMGRMAVAIAGHLDARGTYFGFDVVEDGVQWCRKEISSRYPNFHFQYVPLHNDLYTKTGIDASHFRFPYPDAMFDVIILTSVFTHMLPEEVENYLKEIRRVLKPGGHCYATFFIFTPEEIVDGKTEGGFAFPVDNGYYRLLDATVRHANVAFADEWLKQKIDISGMTLAHQLPGFWRKKYKQEREGLKLDFQDVVVMRRES